MPSRLAALSILAVLLTTAGAAKDKTKRVLPEDVLRAHRVFVIIDPEAGEPLDQPYANANAREAVEKALIEWGRFDLVSEGQEVDLIIAVRTGNGRSMQPTVRGGPIDQRPGTAQSTDSTTRIGVHQGQPPPLQDPSAAPPSRAPHVTNEVGPSEDMFEVYRGNVPNPLDSTPVWRYIAKDCLREPKVAAVEEFRKAIAEAEKPQVPKKP
jgi:hypothetical protein